MRDASLRLLKSGLPSVFSSAVAATVPLLGGLFLAPERYVVWAFAATLATVSIVLDFGAPALATKLASESRLSKRDHRRLAYVSAGAPLLLGALIVLAWPWYCSVAQLEVAEDAVPLFLIVSLGTSLRSAGLVDAAVLLGQGRFQERGLLLLSSAVTQMVVTCAGLLLKQDVMVYGYGVLAAGFVGAALGIWRRQGCAYFDSGHAGVDGLIWRFARSKGVAVVLGMFVTQFDRWAIAVVATPAVVTAYDIASRIASIPKIALISLASGLVAEASRAATDRNTLDQLVRHSVKCNALLSGLGAACSIAACLFWFGSEAVALIAFVIAAHAVNGMTIAPSFVLTGLGRPDLELRYIVPLAGTSCIAYAVGIWLNDVNVSVATWSLGMIAWSAWFVLKSLSFVGVSFNAVRAAEGR